MLIDATIWDKETKQSKNNAILYYEVLLSW
jgi:hypothetical protein